MIEFKSIFDYEDIDYERKKLKIKKEIYKSFYELLIFNKNNILIVLLLPVFILITIFLYSILNVKDAFIIIFITFAACFGLYLFSTISYTKTNVNNANVMELIKIYKAIKVILTSNDIEKVYESFKVFIEDNYFSHYPRVKYWIVAQKLGFNSIDKAENNEILTEIKKHIKKKKENEYNFLKDDITNRLNIN